jgi:hypothetical protein
MQQRGLRAALSRCVSLPHPPRGFPIIRPTGAPLRQAFATGRSPMGRVSCVLEKIAKTFKPAANGKLVNQLEWDLLPILV